MSPQTRSDHWLEAILAIALLGTALLVFPNLSPVNEPFLAPKLLVLGLSGAAAAVILARSITDNRLALTGFDLALAGYFLVGLVAWAVRPGCAAQGALLLAKEAAAVLLLLAASRAAREPRHAERLIGILILMGVLVAALALLEALGVALPWQGIRRPQSTLGNRNLVAAQVAIVLPLAGARLLAAPGVGRAAVVALLTLVTVLTRCRSLWLAVPAAGLITAALYAVARYRNVPVPSPNRRALTLATGSVFAAIVAAALLPWPGLHWTEPAPMLSSLQRLAAYNEGSGRVRVNQHQVGLAILAEHPLLGVGPGNWDDAAAAHAHAVPGEHAPPWTVALSPQSDLLRTAAERGLAGSACLLAAGVLLVAGAWRRMQRGEAPAGLTLALLAALIIAAIHGLLDAPLFRPASLTLIAVLAGLLRDPRPRLSVPLPRPVQRGFLLALGTLIAVVIGLRTLAVLELRTGRDLIAAQRAALAWFPDPAWAEEIIRTQGLAGRCDAIQDLLASAQRWSPHHWGVWTIAAQCAGKRGADHEAADLLAVARRIEPHADNSFSLLSRPGWQPIVLSVTGAKATGVRFGQAQSHLEEFQGLPLIAANWWGTFRPYLWRDGRFVSLLDPAADRTLDHVDLYSPTPLGPGHILMVGHVEGRPAFDLYLLDVDRRHVTNLTNTPQIDEGDFCVAPTGERLSYREDRTQRVAVRRGDALEPLPATATPGFRRCLWLDETTLFGLLEEQGRYTLYLCRDGETGFQCAPTPVLADAERVGEFWRAADGRVGIAARRRGADRYALYALTLTAGTPTRVALTPPVSLQGDMLGFDGDVWRYGAQGRYGTSLDGGQSATVLRHRAINGTHFAIAADCAAPRSLAVFTAGRWELLPRTPWNPGGAPCPEPVSLPGRRHDRYPAVYFTVPDATRAVVWLHGGPRENVSPRYSPYFDRLNRLGFAVLAVNYPGSTGFGADYEAQFQDPALLTDSVDAAVRYLAGHGIKRIVAWSVSTGASVLRTALAGGVRFSAVVDQAGFDNTDLLNLTHAAGTPYFSIRGSNDRVGKAHDFDFVYRGGHDITDFHDFMALFERVGPFLETAPVLDGTP
ncbi:MAG: O-antigen ligase family protein [Candidatus Competibacteraceae bacterium]